MVFQKGQVAWNKGLKSVSDEDQKANQIRLQKEWNKAHPHYARDYAHRRGITHPMEENKQCASYLGVYVAERALSKFFDNITRMPFGNPGYDFICGKGFKIDVKSSTLHHRPGRTDSWRFHSEFNEVPDYFLCLGFNDDRDDLEPMHVWLIPGKIINKRSLIAIRNNEKSLKEYAIYERPLARVVACCAELK